MDQPLYPLCTDPVYRHYIWGGAALHDLLGKPLGPEGTLAESWEIADDALAANGPLEGQRLCAIDEVTGGALTGDAPHYPNARLALLIKLSHAAQDLSVQIHPNDEQAQRYDSEKGYPGKSEMYLILHADRGAGIYWGLRAGVTPSQLEEACRSGQGVPDLLNFVPVAAGDVLYSPSRVVHAIGKGIVYCEVQQNSDITYRLYDWGRVGTDGKPRPLHLAQAMRVIDPHPRAQPRIQPLELALSGGTLSETRYAQSGSGIISYQVDAPVRGRRSMLCASPHFAVELLELEGPADLARARRALAAAIVLEGQLTLRGEGPHVATAGMGQSVALPASMQRIIAEPEVATRVILAYLPDMQADVIGPLRAAGYGDADIAQLGDVQGL
jgi:mannose-6-phosphate isomerase